RNEEETRYFPTLKYAGQRMEFMFRNAQIVVNEQAWLLLDQVLYYFDEPLEGKKLSPFLQKRYIAVPRATERKYFEVFVRGLIERHHVYAEGFAIKTYQHEATPLLKLSSREGEKVRLELAFQYGPYEFAPAQDSRVTVRMEYDDASDRYTFHRIRRSRVWEQQQLSTLEELGVHKKAGLIGGLTLCNTDGENLPPWALGSWLQANKSLLETKGFKIVQDASSAQRYFLGATSLSLDIREQNDWFDVHAVAKFGPFEIPFMKLKSYILSGKREFVLPNGEIALIPDEWFAKYPQLLQFATAAGPSGMQVQKHHMGLLHELEDQKIGTLEEISFSRRLERLESFDNLVDVPLPKGFHGTLRPYQQAGFNWFYYLKTHKFGGCLADDMGLGKPIQTLALLQKEKEDSLVPGMLPPSLIIMPTSLIYNC